MSIEIWDCRKKDKTVITRPGNSGDVEIRFFDEDGEFLFAEWYQMKKPYEKNFDKIVELFSKFKLLLERQE